MALIQEGNTKLADARIPMFNLPAGKKTCGRVCEGCYAVREQQRWPSVIVGREKRFEASKQDDFADTIIKELSKRKELPKYFRVHASGDFYSKEYINAWYTVAVKFPTVTFFAYTKRGKKFDFSELKSLPNFVLINSMQYGKVNYGKREEAPQGVFVCPDVKGADVSCGVDCTYCQTKAAQEFAPYFIKH